MPTNSNYDRYFTGFGDVPIFTYGMITITAGVLAYMTYMDPYIPEEAVESAEPILEATSMDGLVASNPMDTTGAAIPEEVPLQEEQAAPIQEAEPIPEAEPIQEAELIPEAEPIQEEKPVAGGKRKKRTTRRRPISSGKKC
jgi:outer membrane biosynthesis protein TonB